MRHGHPCFSVPPDIAGSNTEFRERGDPPSINNLEIKAQSISLLHHFTVKIREGKMTFIFFCVGINGDRIWQL